MENDANESAMVVGYVEESINDVDEEIMEVDANQEVAVVAYAGEIRKHVEQENELELSDLSKVDVTSCFTGLRAKTMLELLELYKDQAYELGFGIRTSTSRGEKCGLIFERYYVCSCEGFSKTKTDSPVTPVSHTFDVPKSSKAAGKRKMRTRRNVVTRTGCKAGIRFKLVKGAFEVMHHVTNHNHPFNRTAWQYLDRSVRRITGEKAMAIEGLEEAGVKPSVAFRYMAHQAGGIQAVGHTYKDHMNVVNRLRMQSIEGGDANTVRRRLEKREHEEKDFYYKVMINDEDDRLVALFWRDSMMKEDYELYGDFVVFDTTYRTNKYNLICAPIVGMNNHGSIVMFSCAFIADEKAKTFKWLLQTFIKSMGGKEPTTIFTDQDPAMAKAIQKIFPDTKHRLCLWHINQNAISHFGELKKDGPFKDAFNYCLKKCKNEAEFEEKWNAMIKTYKLEDKDWFQRLYSIRDRWCPALNKDFFSAGTLSSQRSESTNKALSFNASKCTTLNRFLTIFNDTVERWRANETLKERQCASSFPKSAVNAAKILKHAAQVYTLSIYYKFEKEYKLAQATKAVKIFSLGEAVKYEVSPEVDENDIETVEFVQNAECVSVNCSCKTFEETGILCFHCIRVLHINSVPEIPAQYIRKRWTKMAKSEVWDKLKATGTNENLNKDLIPWRHHMARGYYNLILRSEGDPDTRKLIDETFSQTSHRITEILASKIEQATRSTIEGTSSASTIEGTSSASTIEGTSSATEPPRIKDPSPTKTKGRSKRIQRWPSNKKAKKNEFGTKTPKLI